MYTSALAPAAPHPRPPPPLSVVLAGPFLACFTSALAALQHVAFPSRCPRALWKRPPALPHAALWPAPGHGHLCSVLTGCVLSSLISFSLEPADFDVKVH